MKDSSNETLYLRRFSHRGPSVEPKPSFCKPLIRFISDSELLKSQDSHKRVIDCHDKHSTRILKLGMI
jgi:hypothetical protein